MALTREEVLNYRYSRPELAPETAPVEKPKGSAFDLIASFGSGAGSLVSGVGTFFAGSDSTLAELGYNAQDYWNERKSARLKAEEAELNKRITEGDWSGAGSKVLSSPFLAANLLAGSAPAMVAGMGVGGLVGRGMAGAGAMTNAAGQLTRAGGAVASGIGEGAFIATDVYEATKGNLAAAGAAGVLLGVGVSAITPSSVGAGFARKVAGTADDGLTVASQAITGGAAALGREGIDYAAARAVRTGAQEFSQEFVQEGGQALIEQLGKGEELNFRSAAAQAVVGGILGAQTGVSLHPFVGEGSKASELQDAMRAKQVIEQLGQGADPVSEQQRLQALRIADARVDVLTAELAVVEKRGEATAGEKLAVDAAHAREEAARNPADDLARSKAALLTITSQTADIPPEQRTPTQAQAAKVAELDYLAAKNPDNQELKDQADTAKAAMLLNETSPEAVREGANKAARIAQTAILEAPTLDLTLQDFSRAEEASAVGRTVVGGLTSTLKGVEQAAAQTLSDTYDENSKAQKAEEKAILEAEKARKQAQKDAVATAQQETKVAKLNQERVKLGLPTIDASMVPEATGTDTQLEQAPQTPRPESQATAEPATPSVPSASDIDNLLDAIVDDEKSRFGLDESAARQEANNYLHDFQTSTFANIERDMKSFSADSPHLALAEAVLAKRRAAEPAQQVEPAPAAARTPRTSMTVAEAERRLRTMRQGDGDSQQRIDETVANLRREAATGDVDGIEAVARGFESHNDHRPAEFLRALLDEREAGGTTAATAPVPGSTQDIQNRLNTREQTATEPASATSPGAPAELATTGDAMFNDGYSRDAINEMHGLTNQQLIDTSNDMSALRSKREHAFEILTNRQNQYVMGRAQFNARENALENALAALAQVSGRTVDQISTMIAGATNQVLNNILNNPSVQYRNEQHALARIAVAYKNNTHLGNVDQFITPAAATPATAAAAAAAAPSGLSRAEIESEYESALEDWADNMGSTVSTARRHVEGLSDERILQGLDDPDLAPYMLPVAQYRNLPIPDNVLNPPAPDTREVESNFEQRAMKALRNGTLNKLGTFWREVMRGRGQRVFNIDTSDLAYRHDNYYDIEQSSLDELKDRYNDELNRQAQRWARENNQPLTTLINPIVAIDVGNGSIAIKVHSLGRQGQNPYAVPANDTNTGVAWMDKDDGHMTTTQLAAAKGSSNLAYRLAAEIARMAGQNVPAASSLLTNNRMRRHMQSIYADYIFGAGHVLPMQSDGDESYQGIPAQVWEAMNSDNQRAGLNILRAAHQATENRFGGLIPISRFIENLSYNAQGQIVATSDPKHSRGWAKGTVVTDDMLTQKLLEVDRDFDFDASWDRTKFRPGDPRNSGETAAGRSGSGGVGPDTAKLVIMTNTILNRIENDPDATIPAAWVTRAKKIGREIGGWMFSEAETAGAKGIDADEAVARVTAMVGENVARVLLDSGMIDFVQTGAELTGETFSDSNGKVQGATTPDGKIILVLDNLSDKTFDAVLSHEAIHATLKNLLGDDTYNTLMSRLDTMLKAGEGSQWVKDANARVPAGTSEQDRLEEIAGYAVELHVRGGTRGNPLVQWAKDFMSALRTAIIQNKALPEKLRTWAMQNIQPADLSRMAIAGLKRAAAQREAELKPNPKATSINVGLVVGMGETAETLTPEFVLAEIEKLGVKVGRNNVVDASYEHNGETINETTLVAELDRALTPAEVERLAINTKQQAIPQRVDGVGSLYGPKAAEWGGFNPHEFRELNGRRSDEVARQSQVTYAPVDTKSPAFKRWFGDSKVVDADGKPLMVYHYSPSDNRSSIAERGLIGSDATSPGGDRVLFVSDTYKPQPGMDAYAIDASDLSLHPDETTEAPDGERWFAVYGDISTTQIKSAIGNNGQFDPANPDIRESRARNWDAEIKALMEEHRDPKTTNARRSQINDELRSARMFQRADQEVRYAARTGNQFSVGASYGTPREGAVSVVGVHFGNTHRNVLNSVAYGKGIKGEEAARLQGQDDIRPRTMFYVDEGNGVIKEPGLGNVGKQVRLNNLYDLREDALNLASNDLNAMERAIMAAGFDGYYRPNYRDMGQGVVVVVGKHDIPVEPYVPGEGAAPAPAYTGNQYAEALAKSKLPGGAMLGREWLVAITGTEFDTPPVRAQLEQRQGERVYRDDLPRFNRGLRYSMSEEHQAIDSPVAEELPNTLNILDLARRSPFERALEKMRINIQDKHTTLRRIQQLAGVVREYTKLDTISALERLGSKLMVVQEQLVDAPLAKIESILTKAGFTAEEARKSLDDLLVARHAAEYNEHTATINPAKYDAAGNYLGGHDAKHPGSGVTDGQARDTIRLLTGTPGAKTTALLAAEEVYRDMIKDLQRFAVERGLEKQETIDKWNDKFLFYTPFNRELNLEENLSVGSVPGAAGFSLRSGIARRAMGSGADIISPLASTALWGLKTTQRGENAIVSRTFLEFAKFVTPNYMSADGKLKPMWSVEKIPNTRVIKKVNVYLVPKADGGMSPEFYNREQARAYADMQQAMWEQSNPDADPDTSGIEVQRPYDEPQNRVLIQPIPNYLNEPNVMVIPVEGENVIITFDPKSKDAMAILNAFKNKAGSGEGAQKLNKLLAIPRMFSRWVMATSTGYNPVFMVFNALRDVQAAIVNAGADQIPGWTKADGAAIAGNWVGAMRMINKRLREEFNQLHSNDYTAPPVEPDSMGEWMDRMKAAGGATGITHSIVDVESAETQMRRLFGQAVLDQAKPVGSPDDFLTKMDEFVAKVGDKFYNFGQGESKGKVMGALSKNLPARAARWNEAAELTTRTLVFKRATELYMKAGHDVETAEKLAANISKNISTNFNRRGDWTNVINQLFPFFNAAANGTARLAETIWEKGTRETNVNGQVMLDQKTKLTPYGKKVMGVIGSIGFLQSALLLMAGFDDDDIPEEVKDRNFIIPIGGLFSSYGDKDYIKIPMPHGFNLLVNLGRNFGDAAYHIATGERGKAAKNLYSATIGQLSALNPVGSAGNIVTDYLPAIADPFVSLAMNKDAFGRPIAKEDRNPANPTPGFTRAKEGASTTGRILAEGLNTLSGGNEDQKGFISPTPDQIDFVLGTAGGGVGREAMKVFEFGVAKIKDVAGKEREVMPSQKLPLIGRLYGDAGEPSALRSKLFAVSTEVNETYARYKGLKERGLTEEAAAFKAEHPEISLRDDIERFASGNAKQTKARALAREEAEIAEVNRITNKQDAAIATLLDKYQKLK